MIEDGNGKVDVSFGLGTKYSRFRDRWERSKRDLHREGQDYGRIVKVEVELLGRYRMLCA